MVGPAASADSLSALGCWKPVEHPGDVFKMVHAADCGWCGRRFLRLDAHLLQVAAVFFILEHRQCPLPLYSPEPFVCLRAASSARRRSNMDRISVSSTWGCGTGGSSRDCIVSRSFCRACATR